MTALYGKIEAADIVVFATPLYYFGFPAQLKAVIDRLYPYCRERRERSIDGKRCVLLCCGATDELPEFDALLLNYRILAHYLGWEDAGSLIAPDLFDKGAIEGTRWPEAAAALADSL